MTHTELVQWIHDEIQAMGTSSQFLGHGLSVETGEYDAEAIAQTIESGELKFDDLDISKYDLPSL